MRAAVPALLLALVVLALAACGGGDEGPAAGGETRAPGGGQPAAEAPPALSSAEQETALRSMLVWQGSGPEGDLDAAYESCRKEVEARQSAPGPALARFADALRCLEDKGWKMAPKGDS
jgi:hypothetical protein